MDVAAVAAALAERLRERHGAFWFANREAAAGAMLGFPHVFLPLDPVALVDDAVRIGDAARIEALEAELDARLAAVPAGNSGDAPLDAARYRALLDPELVQFLVFERAMLDATLALGCGAAAAKLRAAIASAHVDVGVRDDADLVWRAPFSRVDAAMPVAQAPLRAAEALLRLASTSWTAPAEEGFWADVVFRLPGVRRHDARLLGVLRPQATHRLVARAADDHPTLPARLFSVDADDLRGALAGLGSDRAAHHDDLVGVAFDRATQLRAMVLAMSPSSSLVMRRLTVADAAREPVAEAVARGMRDR